MAEFRSRFRSRLLALAVFRPRLLEEDLLEERARMMAESRMMAEFVAVLRTPEGQACVAATHRNALSDVGTIRRHCTGLLGLARARHFLLARLYCTRVGTRSAA